MSSQRAGGRTRVNINPIKCKQQLLPQGWHQTWPGQQLCRRPGQPNAQAVQHQSEVHPCSKGIYPQIMLFEPYWSWHSGQNHFSLLPSSCQGPLGGLGPVQGSPWQRGRDQAATSTQKDSPGEQTEGAQDLQDAGGTGGRCRWTLFKGTQWQEEMQGAQVAKYRFIFFFSPPWGWSDIGLAVKSSSSK